MFKNHLKIAIRNLRRQPFYSWINIGGLTLSLTVGLLMLLWIWDEVKVNRFQVNGERLQKVYMGFFDANGKLEPWESASFPLGQAAKEQIPEVADVISIETIAETTVSRENRQFKGKGLDATINLFDWMSFPLITGSFDPEHSHVGQLAISKSMAERLFGNNWQNTAIGQSVQIGESGDPLPVAAVFEDVPVYSTLQFDFVLNLERRAGDNLSGNWGNHNFLTYLLLENPADAEKVEKKISDIYINSEAYDEGEMVITQSFRDEYLYSRFDQDGSVAGGRIEYVRIFFFASIFLLLIACVNFINLSTARAAKRAKEVGVRKIVGAPRRALIRQFMAESSLITVFSVLLSLTLVGLLLPSVRQLTGKMIHMEPTSPVFLGGILALTVVTALLSGAYPAFMLSAFRVKNILQGKLFTRAGHGSVRQALVVFQFVLSFILIVGALVVQHQVQYIKNKNLGLDRENVIQVSLSEAVSQKFEVIRAGLEQSEGIASFSIVSENPLAVNFRSNGVDWPGKKTGDWKIHFDMILAEENFPQTFGAQMVAGRFYETEQRADSNAIVVNETAARVMGLEDPVGKVINVFGEDRQIIGVINDFHTMSLYKSIPPVVIGERQHWNHELFLRTEAGKTTEALASLEAVLERVVPDYSLQYTFLDESYARQYSAEALMGTLANWFALFSVLISCLGMFGLATFSAENRAKEIGVRRVLGATVFQIVQLLSANFIRLVMLAGVLALPLAYYFSRSWLEQFAYRAGLAWWVFGAAFFLVLTVSMLTVGIQGFKAGTVNPVKRLRSE